MRKAAKPNGRARDFELARIGWSWKGGAVIGMRDDLADVVRGGLAKDGPGRWSEE